MNTTFDTAVDTADDSASTEGSRKRVNIDPAAITANTYKKTDRNDRQPPLKSALDFLEGTIVTLHTDYQSTVRRVGEDFSKAFDAYQRNSKTLAGMIECTDPDGTIVPSRIPRSARINFELKTGSRTIEDSTEFKALLEESKNAITAYQNKQAIILVRCKRLEVENSKTHVLETLAKAMYTLAKGHLLIYGQADTSSKLWPRLCTHSQKDICSSTDKPNWTHTSWLTPPSNVTGSSSYAN